MIRRAELLGACVVVAFYAWLQYAWLPADGFFAGDQGTKYLQVRAAAEQGPLTPWIEGPSLDLDPDLRYQEPLIVRNDGRLVGIFPWILPAVAAPFYRAGGLSGMYAVPALAVAAMFVAACRLGRRCGIARQGLPAGLSAVAATPLLFYGAEFWEHAPAVALTTIAAALVLAETRRASSLAIAGVCLGFAAGLRPEALLMMPALMLARAWTAGPRDAVRTGAWMTAGGAGSLALIAGGNAAVYGGWLGPQLGVNLDYRSYLAVRLEAVRLFLLPVWHKKLFVAAAVVALLCALRPSLARSRVWTSHLAVAALFTVLVVVPLWRCFIEGRAWQTVFEYRSAVYTCPFAVALVYWMALRRTPGASDRASAGLVLAGVLFVLGALATMPHTGGAQWSARFLLPAMPLFAIVASRLPIDPPFDLPLLERRLVRIFTAVLIASSIAIQANGLAFLRDAKNTNAKLSARFAALFEPGAVVVTDMYWVPEVTATLYPSRRYLFSWGSDDVHAIAERVAAAGIARFDFVSCTALTRYEPPRTFALRDGSSFTRTEAIDLHDRALGLHRYALVRKTP